MMGVVTTVFARDIAAERIRAVERARAKRKPASSVVGSAATRSRVIQSLLFAPHRRESATKETR